MQGQALASRTRPGAFGARKAPAGVYIDMCVYPHETFWASLSLLAQACVVERLQLADSLVDEAYSSRCVYILLA